MFDVGKEVGKLIEARKAYKGNKPIFERFNILVSLIRVWRDTRDLNHRLLVAKAINRTRVELAELGVQV